MGPPFKPLSQGTPERLIQHLVEDHSVVDPTYIEDFLLTYHTFVSSPLIVCKRLLDWFNNPSLRDKVTRVVLLWVNNHFSDFEGNPDMINFLDEFQDCLEREKMTGQLQLLNIACAAKAKPRVVSFKRVSQEMPLPFTLIGGAEQGTSIFISSVEVGSKAEEAGLKRGDQILEVNEQTFKNVQLSKATEILKNNMHLSLTVKTNLLVFKELVVQERKDGIPHLLRTGEMKKGSSYSVPEIGSASEVKGPEKIINKAKAHTVGGRNKLMKILDKTCSSILPQKPYSHFRLGKTQGDGIEGLKQTKQPLSTVSIAGNLSSSNSDDLDYSTQQPELQDQVLRVFKADQQSRYLLINRDTTAREAANLAVREFGLTAGPDAYSLCEVSVTPEGVIKQRRLPDQLSKLADRIHLCGRYYLKSNMETEILCSDMEAQKLKREAEVSLLSLSPTEIANQLSARSYLLFSSIEPTDYITDLFKLRPCEPLSSLHRFEDLINQEMFWVATEVLQEPNKTKRMKIIKHFIKVALHCRDCKNFNSMFAIISGLNLAPVSRLRATWDLLPAKYDMLLSELQEVFDPSRNMAKYRNLLNKHNRQPPIIPLFPIIKKDLTFLHEGNASKVDGLVNFEKLRMIAREVRNVAGMASVNMDPDMLFKTSSLCQVSSSAKKLYKAEMMSRRMCQYLDMLTYESNEDTLRSLSLQWEPARNTGPSKILPLSEEGQKRQPEDKQFNASPPMSSPLSSPDCSQRATLGCAGNFRGAEFSHSSR